MTKFAGRFRKQTPKEIYADGEGTSYQDPAILTKAIQRAKYFFPGIVQHETEVFQEDFIDTRQLCTFLLKRVNERYNDPNQSQEERERLMKRENAVELCVKLGMSECIVTLRFMAVEAILNELGVSGKMSVIKSVHFLVESLDLENPFSDQVDEATREAIPWLTYQAVGFEQGKLDQALQEASALLERTRTTNELKT
ncbi:MAG: hypothetical protein SGARI_000156, partial [Bacillariaceae sp.]